MAEAVKVIVRCRPLNNRETSMNCETVVQMDSNVGQCYLHKPKNTTEPPKTFTFDGAYYVDSTTENIYNEICFPLVDGVLEGYNGTVFAYGQTGCGKSFSMMGISEPATQRGIIPRAFEHIFECIQVADDMKYLVHASYLEIYNEEIRDLLGHDHKQRHELKEHPERGVYVKDLSLHPVNSVKEMEHVMELGSKNRSVGSTLMNADSSRSHSIFAINIEMIGTGDDGGEHIRAGKLNLVDLAGSERQAKTGATGTRLKEATKINLSLSALGNVISALVDGKSKHIPYRDSKLTRLLQDSLGGNTKTLMVACLSPADNNYDETLSTLRYANRAKNIKNKPKINEDPKDALLREYKEEIEKLKAMLMGQMNIPKELLDGTGVPAQTSSKPKKPLTKAESVAVEEAEEIKHEYEQKLAEMKAMFEAEQVSKQKLQEEMKQLKQVYEGKIHDVEEKTGGDIPGFSGLREPSDLRQPDGSSGPPTPSHPTDQGGAVPGSHVSIIGLEGSQQALNGQPATADAQAIGSLHGFSPPPSSPTGDRESTIKANVEMQAAALKRLQELQEKMVGGERKNDPKLKDIRKERKAIALSRKEKLVKAIKKMDKGDQVMLKVYDTMQDEIKAKTAMISSLEAQVKSSENEIDDLQYEFERDREDYLETIRRQEQTIKLQQQILNRIQPCIRRDCNYYNLDKIKTECRWNEDEGVWILPDLVVTRTTLPTPGIMPGANVQRGGALLPGRRSPNPNPNRIAPSNEPEVNGYFHDDEEDKYLKHLNSNSKEDITQSYFAPKRANKLLSETTNNFKHEANPHNFKPSHSHGHSHGHNLPNVDRRSSQNMHPHHPFEANTNPLSLGGRPARLESLHMHNMEKESKKKRKSHKNYMNYP